MHPIEPEELMAYLDGELLPERAAEAAQHIPDCQECQLAVAEMQRVSRRLVEWQVDEPGARVEQAINSARTLGRSRPVWKRRMLWIGGLAAACVAALAWIPVSYQRAGSVTSLVSSNGLASTGKGEAGLPDFGTRLKATFEPRPQLRAEPQIAAQGYAASREPLVIRTAQITLTTSTFAQARTAIEEMLKRNGGHISTLAVASPPDSGRTLQAKLRVPVNRLDTAMAEIRRLGRVETEQQGGEEVGAQMVDLEARLANARNTEQRLSDILRHNTGKITDVLAVETEIDRVRGEIERMDAEHKNLGDRVAYATIDVWVKEEYKAHLAVSSPSTPGRLRNSAVEGYRNAADSLTGVAMLLLSWGPVAVLWAALVFIPGRYAWRRLRRSRVQKQAEGFR